MQDNRALEILNSLAQGFDPDTGEILPREHVLQQPDVIRALGQAVSIFRQYIGESVRADREPARAGQAWSAGEDERLLKSFDRGTPIKELAATHERTRGAIESRLVKLGRIERTTNS